jgi:hypothetical protein
VSVVPPPHLNNNFHAFDTWIATYGLTAAHEPRGLLLHQAGRTSSRHWFCRNKWNGQAVSSPEELGRKCGEVTLACHILLFPRCRRCRVLSSLMAMRCLDRQWATAAPSFGTGAPILFPPTSHPGISPANPLSRVAIPSLSPSAKVIFRAKWETRLRRKSSYNTTKKREK